VRGQGARRWPFVERDEELAALAVSTAGVVIAGEAGVGKSRLLSELVEVLQRDGASVVHVGATSALADVPFGLFAGALLGKGAPSTHYEALSATLAELAGDRPLDELVIGVDDAHLVDEASAGLLLLAAGAGARVIATIRDGEPCPDAVTSWWKDEYAERWALEPLDELQLGTLFAVAHEAPLDGRSLRRLYDVTLGNLLFVRELMVDAHRSGTLVQRGGVWTWTETSLQASSVRDLVAARLAHAAPEVVALVELLAIGEPLGRGAVERLADPDALAAAERDGLVVWEQSGARQEVRLVHPLYAEALRESLGRSRRAAASRAVAEALADAGTRRRGDRLRTTVLRLDGGTAEAEELRQGAKDAGVRGDLLLGERLARAALDADGSTKSLMTLAEVLYWAGRNRELVDLLGREPPADATANEVARIALIVASSLFWGLDDFDAAQRWLDRGLERAEPPFELELLGQRSMMLFFAGRNVESIAVGRQVLSDADASAAARLRAIAGILPSCAVCGRLSEVKAELSTAFGLIGEVEDELTIYQAGGVIVSSFLVNLFDGGYASTDELVQGLHAAALARPGDPFMGVWSFLLGRSALAQGRLGDAERYLRESTALLRDRDPGSMLTWSLASLAQVLGMTGDSVGAVEAIADVDATRMRSVCHVDVEIELGRAWAAAALGELSRARATAEDIGRRLLADGTNATGALALHGALRLGIDPQRVAGALREAADASDGAVLDAMAAHAEAAATGDVDGLLGAADAFELAGCLLCACECAASAVQAADAVGSTSRARSAMTRAAALRAACGAAATPLLAPLSGRPGVDRLTRREHEVALLAARGLSKREIADRLYLSVRTVGNHINHIYGKLLIHSRDELRDVVGSPPAAAERK
jgi:DNA-binding NarL/FixJ family response regulator